MAIPRHRRHNAVKQPQDEAVLWTALSWADDPVAALEQILLITIGMRRHILSRIGFGAAMALSISLCTSSIAREEAMAGAGNAVAGGATGGAGEPGGGGVPGNDGIGGANPPNLLPGCVTDLSTACPLRGPCTVDDVNGDGSPMRRCFADGFKEVFIPAETCFGGEKTVYRGYGSLLC